MGLLSSGDSNRPVTLRHVDVCVIFVVAVSIRLLLLKEVLEQIGLGPLWTLAPDGVHYVDMAWDMVRGTDRASYFLTTWPPGYPTFLALQMTIFGGASLVPLLVQILLSSASTILLYALALQLTGRRLIAFLSGLLLALSSTSISLSVMLLSDTLFLFLFVGGFLLFVRALKTGGWKYFIWSGLLTGNAILVRAIGEFWPTVMLVVAALFALSMTAAKSHTIHETRRSLMNKALVCIGIVVAIEGSWMVRNYCVHGKFFLTTVDSGGLANIAAFRCERSGGEFFRDVRAKWQESYAREHGLNKLPPEAMREADIQAAVETLQQHPGQFIEAYLALVWENLNAVNQTFRHLLPEHRSQAAEIEAYLQAYYLNYLAFALSALGFLALVFRRSYVAAMVLGLTFLYFALTIGVTRWQGSRLFLPGQVAALPLISAAIASLLDLIRSAGKKMLHALRLVSDSV